MYQVNVTVPWLFDEVEKMKKDFPGFNFIKGRDNIENCNILWGGASLNDLRSYKNLKFVQVLSAGVDGLVNGGFPQNVKLSCASGAYDLSISEHMLAMHLSLYRRLHLHRDSQHEQEWVRHGLVKSVKNSTVLVIGLGGIGSAYAKLVKSMGAYVIGVRRTDTRKPDYVDELYLSDNFQDVLPRVDMIALATPATKRTYKMVNKDFIDKMKDGSMIINIGRGSLVETEALCDALETGKLAGAGLDVTDPEPLPKDHRLWKIKSALITPHCAGGDGIPETEQVMIDIFRENLTRFIDGKTLVNEVDFESGYRQLNP